MHLFLLIPKQKRWGTNAFHFKFKCSEQFEFFGFTSERMPACNGFKQLWFGATVEYQRYGKRQEVEEVY